MIRLSEDFKFDEDVVSLRMTARFGGVCVAEAASVQVVVPGS
jgi:hypothetical protein